MLFEHQKKTLIHAGYHFWVEGEHQKERNYNKVGISFNHHK